MEATNRYGVRKKLVMLFAVVLLAFGVSIAGTAVSADKAYAESGTYGGASWDITNGVLTLGDGTEQTMTTGTGYLYAGSYPWYSYANAITSVGIDGIVHISGDMDGMFSNCPHLMSVDLTGLDTIGVTSMNSLFSGDTRLTTIEFGSGFDTSASTNIASMFSQCKSLTALDLRAFDTRNVVSASSVFSGCSALTSIQFGSNFSMANVVRMNSLFEGCSSLTSLNLSNWHVSNKLTDVGSLFRDCTSLQSITGISDWDTSNVTSFSMAFFDCCSITSLDVSSWSCASATSIDMFSNCASLETLVLSRDFSFSKVPYPSKIFETCYSLCDITLPNTLVAKGSFNSIQPFGTSSALWMLASDSSVSLTGTQLVDGTSNNQSYARWIATRPTASGSIGGVSWSIDSYGALEIYPTNGVSGQLSYNFPWTAPTYRPLVKTVHVSSGVVAPSSGCRNMFSSLPMCTSIDLSGLTTTGVTAVNGMFSNCTALTSVTFGSGFDTSSVTDFSYMFSGCNSLRLLDLSGFDTSSATNMNGMFSACRSLSSITFGDDWDTSHVTGMGGMFQHCYALVSLDLTKFDTSSVTNMGSMFWNCPALQTVNISSFDLTNVTTMEGMFALCKSLQSLSFPNCATPNLTNMKQLCWECYELGSIEFGSNWDTSHVTDFNSVFGNCNSLTSLDISMFDTSSAEDMGSMFGECHLLRSLLFGEDFVTTNVTNMGYMFSGCRSLSAFPIDKMDTSSCTMMNGMFDNCTSVTSLNLSGWDVSNVTESDSMFDGCTGLASLQVPDFGTSLTSMSCMFQNCPSLQALDLSGFDTANVWNMDCLFADCSSLEVIDFGENFDVTNNQSFGYMFQNCSSLRSLDLSDWNTEIGATNGWMGFESMFDGCSSLESLELGENFVTMHAWDMSCMFRGCSSLKSLDLSGFDTSENWMFNNMFAGCSSLETLDISGFSVPEGGADLTDMFGNCSSLKSVTLGAANPFDNGSDSAYAELPANTLDGTKTGKWVRADGTGDALTPTELRETYTSAMAGTWVLENEVSLEAFAILLTRADASVTNVSVDGFDINPSDTWVTQAQQDAFAEAIDTGRTVYLALGGDSGSLSAGLRGSAYDLEEDGIKPLAFALDTYESQKQAGLASRANLQATIDVAEANLVEVSSDGYDISAADEWTTQVVRDDMDDAIDAAELVAVNQSATDFATPTRNLRSAMLTYDGAKAPGRATIEGLEDLIEEAEAARVPDANISVDGSDIKTSEYWVTQAQQDALDAAIVAAQTVVDNPSGHDIYDDGIAPLHTALDAYNAAKSAGFMLVGDVTISADGTTTYTSHKLFDGAVDSTGKMQHIQVASGVNKANLYAFLQSKGYSGANNDQDMAEWIAAQIAGSSADTVNAENYPIVNGNTFAHELAAWVKQNVVSSGDVTSDTAFTGDQGYWLLVTKTIPDAGGVGTAPIWVAIGDEALEISEKTAVPTVTKYIQEEADSSWGKVADAQTGETVHYKVEFSLPSNYAAFTAYAYELTDTLPTGMAVEANSVHVYVQNAASTEITNAVTGNSGTVTGSDDTVNVIIPDLRAAAYSSAGIVSTSKIVVTYDAHLTSGFAVSSVGNSNTAVVEYSADPMSAATSAIEDEATLFTYGFDMTKQDGANSTLLPNAVYALRVGNLYVQADGSLSATEHTFMTGNDGTFHVDGLDAGTYTLVEVTPPSGYAANSDVTFTFSGTLDAVDGLTAMPFNYSGGASVQFPLNGTMVASAGSNANTGRVAIVMNDDKEISMPLTGAEGTLLITVIGSLIVFGSVIAIRRKRRADEMEA